MAHLGTAGSSERRRGADFGPVAKYVRDPFPAISHWVGAAMAVVGMGALLAHAASLGTVQTATIIAIVVYSVTLVALFGTSAYAHTAVCSEAVSKFLVRLDYAAIFLLIAGTYTPVCVLGVGGTAGRGILLAEWVLAAIGIIMVLADRKGKVFGTIPRVGVYILMGWLGMFVFKPVVAALGTKGLSWFLFGGILYTVGAVIFVTDKPKLWPGKFVAHDLWHILVVAAATAHWFAIRALIG